MGWTTNKVHAQNAKHHRTTNRLVTIHKINKHLSNYRTYREEMINHDPPPLQKNTKQTNKQKQKQKPKKQTNRKKKKIQKSDICR